VGRSGVFGLGLRLGAGAAAELAGAAARCAFRRFLDDQGFYVFTLNGFPYGAFHGTRVKRQVYAPDWRDPRRLRYTTDLAVVLAELLPAGVDGSISTVPGAYRTWIRSRRARLEVLSGLARAALALARLHERSGRLIRLALEPEPDCLWQTTPELIDLFAGMRGADQLEAVARACNVAPASLARAWERHVGVCVDTCHLSVNFEQPGRVLQMLRRHAVPIAKIQISAAPRGPAAAAAPWLARLRDPVYLHQTRVRTPTGRIHPFPDLPPAARLAAFPQGSELRTHFHFPLPLRRWGPFRSTASSLGPAFFRLLRHGICPHLELETYTFAVLPPELQRQGVVRHVAAEYGWFLRRWASAAADDDDDLCTR
jgi:sugar phosphate isomerase/epimerase